MDVKLNKGMLAEGRMEHADSMAAEGEIPFGIGVQRGTNPAKQVKKFAGGTFMGVAIYSATGDIDNSKYKDKRPVTVLRSGVVWVEVESAVIAGDKAAVAMSGNFVKTGTNGSTDIKGEFKTSGSTGDIVKLEINLP